MHSGRKNINAKLIATLAGGATVQAAAQLCEVSERTIHRRLKDRSFLARLSAARAAMIDRSLGHLSEGAVDAAVTLRNLLGSTHEKIKLAAATRLLDSCLRLRDAVDIQDRLARLEGLKNVKHASQARQVGTR
jgi:hypothetical protein